MSETAIDTGPRPTRRRARLMLIPAALLCSIAIALTYLFLTFRPEPSVPLGAAATIPGGMASISGIVPLENDDWEPAEDDDVFSTSPPEGSHRVRIVVNVTSLEADRMQLNAGDFTVSGIGSVEVRPLWSSPVATELRQGESVAANLVFEVPDKAIALVLEGPGQARLSLGLAHHNG